MPLFTLTLLQGITSPEEDWLFQVLELVTVHRLGFWFKGQDQRQDMPPLWERQGSATPAAPWLAIVCELFLLSNGFSRFEGLCPQLQSNTCLHGNCVSAACSDRLCWRQLYHCLLQGTLHCFVTGNEGTFGQEGCKSLMSTTPCPSKALLKQLLVSKASAVHMGFHLWAMQCCLQGSCQAP